MSEFTQLGIVIAIVMAAAAHVGWSVTRSLRGQGDACGSCNACGSSETPKLVQLESRRD